MFEIRHSPAVPLLLLLGALLLGRYPGCEAIVRLSERIAGALAAAQAAARSRAAPVPPRSFAASGGLLIAFGHAQRPPPARPLAAPNPTQPIKGANAMSSRTIMRCPAGGARRHRGRDRGLLIVLRRQRIEQRPRPQASGKVPTIVIHRTANRSAGSADSTYNEGEQIRFKVDSDVADEVHVHGYDIDEGRQGRRLGQLRLPGRRSKASSRPSSRAAKNRSSN